METGCAPNAVTKSTKLLPKVRTFRPRRSGSEAKGCRQNTTCAGNG